MLLSLCLGLTFLHREAYIIIDLIQMCVVDENKYIMSHLCVTQFAEKRRIVNLCKKEHISGKETIVIPQYQSKKGVYVISPSYTLGI